MVNDCVRIGLANNVSTMKRLSQLSYRQLRKYDILSYYKSCAISQAAGILSSRKKSIGRGIKTKNPYVTQPALIAYRGFKIVNNQIIQIPSGNKQYFCIYLNKYVSRTLSSDSHLWIRSFRLASNSLSICHSKEVQQINCMSVVGLDRNLRNMTVGNADKIINYDLTKATNIAETTRSIMGTLKRNDRRIRQSLYSKYGRCRQNRIKQLLHRVSKSIVQKAKQDKTALAFEDISFIRRLYQRGNNQGHDYINTMNNGWSFAEIKRQIEYKAAWEGVPVVQLSIKETRGTSKLCYQCGERLQGSSKTDLIHRRQLWCLRCQRWFDRDLAAAMNLSLKGWQRFCHPQGVASEAMVQESGSKEPVILKVDATKLSLRNNINQRLNRTMFYIGTYLHRDSEGW
jgi:putative transposase